MNVRTLIATLGATAVLIATPAIAGAADLGDPAGTYPSKKACADAGAKLVKTTSYTSYSCFDNAPQGVYRSTSLYAKR